MSLKGKKIINDPGVAHEKLAIMKYIFTSPGSYLGKRKEDNYVDRLQNMIEFKQSPKIQKSIDDLTTTLYSKSVSEKFQPEVNYHLLPSVSYGTKVDPKNSYGLNSSIERDCYRE